MADDVMTRGQTHAIQTDAEEAMLRLRLGTSNRVLLGVCAAGAILVALAWSAAHALLLSLWYALLLATQGVRIWSEVYTCQAESGRPLTQRIAIAGGSALLSGCVQASSILFFMLEDPFEQSLQTLILLVMITGAVVYTAGHPRTYYPYMAPILLGLVLGWWTLSSIAHERPWLVAGFGALILVYGFNLVGYARDTWAMFVNAAAMRHQEALQNRQLAEAVRTAEAASQAKTRFLAAASHDLRQPIHTIALLTGLLKLRHQGDASAEAVMLLDAVVQSLSTQLDDLLDISKLDAGVVKAVAQPVPLQRLLQRCLDEMRNEARGKGLEMRLEIDREATVNVDPNLLERVLRNLLSNAVKFTDRGEVALSLQVLHGQAIVSVRDTGCGIAPQHQREVFHEFVQLNNPERDRAKGMGLGLSIVERLCRLMGIELQLRSTPGQGSVFELRLALHESEGSCESALPRVAMRRFNLTVLVVDDETQVREATAMLLSELGCRCLQAEDLPSALQAVQREQPDLLLADYRLRGGHNGIEVVQALRDRLPGLESAIVSGDIGPSQLRAVENAGLHMLHKPVRLETLLQLLLAFDAPHEQRPASIA